MITHQMEVVKEVCDKVAIMDGGEVIEVNTVENLFKNPKTKTAATFINTVPTDIEEEIINPNNFKGTIIRLSYLGDTSNRPIVSKVIRNFKVDVNILSGNINKLHETKVGHLILELIGDDQEINKALGFLNDENVHVEVI